MNSNYYLLFILLSSLSCQKDKNVAPESNCVVVEQPTSTDIKLLLSPPGPQEYGWAKAIYVNRESEASAHAIISDLDNNLYIVFRTYFNNNLFHTTDDVIFILDEPKVSCYEIATGSNVHDLTGLADYNVLDGDITIHSYSLNTTTDNYLEITEVHTETQTIKGKFMASFTCDDTTANDPMGPTSCSV